MKYTHLLYCLLITTAPIHASWYAGDLCLYDATQPKEQMALRFQEAHDQHLDWRLFYNTPGTGAFVGLPAFIAEEQYNDPRLLVPLLGSAWQDGIVFAGVDARAPIPFQSFKTLQTWTTAHNGMVIFTDPAHPDLETNSHQPVAFQGLSQTGWHPICEPGAQWDSLLTQNHHITLVGGSAVGTPKYPASQTYVFAQSRNPGDLLEGLRRGSVYVAESDGIHVDFRINDQIPGSLVLADEDLVIHIRAAANHPISKAYLIANGEIIWQNHPDQALWHTRIRIPQDDYRYIRLVLESQMGGYQTLTNPIYFSDTYLDPIFPTQDLSRPQTIHFAIDSALESIADLPEEAQARILSEYLQSHQTRYAAVLVLENRDDLIGDYVLETLLNHNNPNVRLGAAFALVVRNTPDLVAQLFGLLNDPAPEIQAYAARIIYQFAPTQNENQLRQAVRTYPAAQSHLIRAINPSTYDAELVRYLIHLSGTRPTATASAAMATLTEFGNRSFRVITTLQDSAKKGHVQSVQILGLIADPRTSEELQNLYLSSPGGPLRRATFHALKNLNAPYPSRPAILCPGLEPAPTLDADLGTIEWKNASHIHLLVNDEDATPGFDTFDMWIGRDKTRLLISATCELPKNLREQSHIEISLSPSPELDVPFIFSITHPEAQSITPIDPLLHLVQQVRDQTWILEGAITLSDLGVDPDTPIPYLRFNVALQTQNNRWSWTPTYGSPETPEHFGNLYINPVTTP